MVFEAWHRRVLSSEFGQGFPILTFAPAGLQSVIADDRLGIPVRSETRRIHLAYPIAVLAAERLA